MRLFEPFSGSFRQDRRRKGPENFAMLDAAIQDLFHFRPARIGHDAAISQRAWPPLRASLEPAEDFSVRNDRGGLPQQVFFGQFADRTAVFPHSRDLDSGANLVA